MILKDAIKETAEKLNLPETFVEKVYRAYWKAIREHISSIPLKGNISDEEFLKSKPNVNIPSLGKLNVTLDRYKRIKYSFKNRQTDAAHKED